MESAAANFCCLLTSVYCNLKKTNFIVLLTELGIDKSIFIKPKTFHLTVLMLKLWNKERVLAASEVLKVNFYY